jgi:hypothetical protein
MSAMLAYGGRVALTDGPRSAGAGFDFLGFFDFAISELHG